MQTKASIKKNRYKFTEGEYAIIVADEETKQPEEIVVVKKRLLRPFRESPNFYVCIHEKNRKKYEKIHYEQEMKHVPEDSDEWSDPLF